MPSRPRMVGPQESDAFAELIRARREELGVTLPELSAMMYGHRCDRHPDGCKLSASVLHGIENGIAITGDRRDTSISYRTRLISVDELVAFIHVLKLPRTAITDWLYDA